tara:strand:+ start:124 stop:432 length:309 start_codon:yes stop_codon:yes gene_type:complete
MNNNINVEETKVVVSNIINRLISEKYLFTSISKTEEDKTCIKLNMISPEWFIELDDEIKYQVDHNIKNVYSKLMLEEAKNMFSSFDDDNDDETHRKKRVKLE